MLAKSSSASYDTAWATPVTSSDLALKANLAGPTTFTGTVTLPTGTVATTQSAGNNTTAVATTAFVTQAIPTGVINPYAGSTAPTGWLLCYGQAVSRTTYAALFAVLSTTYNTGVVAGTDFCLPDLRGRTVAGIDNMGGVDANLLSIANTPGTTTGAETVTLTSAQSGVPTHSHANTLTGTTTFASSGHAHGAGSLTAAIGATNNNPNRIGYIAGTVTGPGTATYSIEAGGLLTSTGNFNHYTPVYGDTGGPNTTGTVGISNVDNTAANASSAHNNMQPTMVLNYIIKS
jgi:microcystin-dependent protein